MVLKQYVVFAATKLVYIWGIYCFNSTWAVPSRHCHLLDFWHFPFVFSCTKSLKQKQHALACGWWKPANGDVDKNRLSNSMEHTKPIWINDSWGQMIGLENPYIYIHSSTLCFVFFAFHIFSCWNASPVIWFYGFLNIWHVACVLNFAERRSCTLWKRQCSHYNYQNSFFSWL